MKLVSKNRNSNICKFITIQIFVEWEVNAIFNLPSPLIGQPLVSEAFRRQDITFFFNYCIFQGQQVIYTANTTGYVMTQGVDGVPMSIPVANQPPMVLVPVPGRIEGQSAMVQVAQTTAKPGTVSFPQEAVKPPSYL